MKYNINIMSKQECTLYSTKDLDDDCIVISINDSNCNTVIYNNSKIKDILKIHFDDITREAKEKYKCNGKLVTMEDLQQIKTFVDKYKDNIHTIIVHCTMGVSRSGAIGCLLARYLYKSDMYLFKKGKYMPNKTVYKLGCEVFGLKWDKREFEYKCNISNKTNDEILKNEYGVNIDSMFNID